MLLVKICRPIYAISYLFRYFFHFRFGIFKEARSGRSKTYLLIWTSIWIEFIWLFVEWKIKMRNSIAKLSQRWRLPRRTHFNHNQISEIKSSFWCKYEKIAAVLSGQQNQSLKKSIGCSFSLQYFWNYRFGHVICLTHGDSKTHDHHVTKKCNQWDLQNSILSFWKKFRRFHRGSRLYAFHGHGFTGCKQDWK